MSSFFFDDRACRQCGCTETSACMDLRLGPCWWVEEDLCSHCRIKGDARLKWLAFGLAGLVLLGAAGWAIWGAFHG